MKSLKYSLKGLYLNDEIFYCLTDLGFGTGKANS